MIASIVVPERIQGQAGASPSSDAPARSRAWEPSRAHVVTAEAETGEIAGARDQLIAERERLQLQRSRLGGPVTLIVAGAGATFLGGLLVFVSNHGAHDCDTSCDASSPLRGAGIAFMVSGLAALVPGIVLTYVRVQARERRGRALDQLDREIELLSDSNELTFTPWLALEQEGLSDARAGLDASLRF